MPIKIRKGASLKNVRNAAVKATAIAKRNWELAENNVNLSPFGSPDLLLRRYIAEIQFQNFCALEAVANALVNHSEK